MAATHIWYFDFVSPFSHLQWQKLRPLLAPFSIECVPILFGAVFDAMGQRGPAEIPHKRVSTYRRAVWQAQQAGVPLKFPDAHPFNPLPALRLCIAAGTTPDSIDALFDLIWARGGDAVTPKGLAPLLARFDIGAAALSSDATKSTLRANTDRALAASVFSACRRWRSVTRCSGATMRMASPKPCCAIPHCWKVARCAASRHCPKAFAGADGNTRVTDRTAVVCALR